MDNQLIIIVFIFIIISIPAFMTILWIQIFDVFVHESGHALVASMYDNSQKICVYMIKDKKKKCFIFKGANITYYINNITIKCGGTTEFENINAYSKKQVRIIGGAGILFGICVCAVYHIGVSSVIYHLIMHSGFYFWLYTLVGIVTYIVVMLYNFIIGLRRYKEDYRNWQNDAVAVFYPEIFRKQYSKQKRKQEIDKC